MTGFKRRSSLVTFVYSLSLPVAQGPALIGEVISRVFLLTLRGQFKLFIIFIQRMVSLMAILFSTKCFLFVYMYIDLSKLKAYKLFENSEADLSRFLFKEANLFVTAFIKTLFSIVTPCVPWF